MDTKKLKAKILNGETITVNWITFKKFLTDEVEFMRNDFNIQIINDKGKIVKIKIAD